MATVPRPKQRPKPADVQISPTVVETMADLLERLGGISPRRVRMQPTPGTATEKDVVEAHEHGRARCDLVDGVLVEKTNMGFEESILASILIGALTEFLRQTDLGRVVGEQGAFRLQPGLVRYADVAFISWDRRPKGKDRKPIPRIVPDLVVEVLSKSNTPKEVARKLDEYFYAGVRLVWIVDPKKRAVRVHRAPEHSTVLTVADTLDGGDVLPGFRLAIGEWFAEADREGPR